MKNKIMTLGMLTIMGIGTYTYTMDPEMRKQMEMERFARQQARQRQEIPTPQAPEPEQPQVTPIAPPPMTGLGEEKYKKHLRSEYDKACDESNVDWLIANKKLLLDKHIVHKDELDMIISAFQAPQREEELAKKRQKQDLEMQHKTCQTLIQKATSAQKAADSLTLLYIALAGKDEALDALKDLSQTVNLEHFFSKLTTLAQNPKVMATIGSEVQMLRGHMLYRVWEKPEILAEQAERALAAFKTAFAKRDMGAMINLYRDFLKKDPVMQKTALSMAFDVLTQAMDRQSIQTLIDTYLYFFKESDQKDTALLVLEDYAQQLIQKRDTENLNKLLICFEKESYEQELKGAIAAIQIDTNGAAAAGNDLPGNASKQVVYDEWQAACINGDLATLLSLQNEAVRLGIVEQYDAEAIIQSLMPTN